MTLSLLEATEIAERIGVDWADVPFDPAQFRAGLEIEIARAMSGGEEADGRDLRCGRIVLARLVERPDHYREELPWGPDGELTPPS